MKILCLHGYGTSGEIFRQQLTSIIQVLGEDHEYVFLDGEAKVVRSGKTSHMFNVKLHLS